MSVDHSDPSAVRSVALGVAWAAVAVFGLAIGSVYHLSGAPLWSALAYPVGAWMTGGILREGAGLLRSGRPISWGGRSYVLRDRSRPAEIGAGTLQVVPAPRASGS